MAKGVLGMTGSLVQARKIEMRVREARVESERVPVLRHGLILALEILEQYGQIERQNRLAGLSAAIDFLGFVEPPVQVQETPKIEPCFEMVLVGRETGLVGGACRRRIGVLELEPLLEGPVGGNGETSGGCVVEDPCSAGETSCRGGDAIGQETRRGGVLAAVPPFCACLSMTKRSPPRAMTSSSRPQGPFRTSSSRSA